MAGISTSVQVQDKLSPAMGAMAASINTTLMAFADFQGAMGHGVDMASINAVQSAMHGMESAAAALDDEMQQAAQGANGASESQRRYNHEIRAGAAGADGLIGKIRTLAGAYLSMQAVKGMFSMSDDIASTTARLNLMNDGAQTTQELFQMVAASADDARSGIGDMASVVARFGNNAKDAFSSSAEVVDFANLISKSMTIAGASTEESAAAMLQLSQALGSGVLRGDELNSIFEQAPNLIGYIAQYLDVPIGKIREMASEGELSADVVKAAIFEASEDINGKFEQMPTTWGQVATQMANTATMAFQPAMEQLSEFASSEDMQVIMGAVSGTLAELGAIASDVIGIMVDGAGFIVENWGFIEPVVTGVAIALGAYLIALGIHSIVAGAAGAAEFFHTVALAAASKGTFAATVAQYGFNAALLACPLTWIVLAIIALIAIIFIAVEAVNHATGSTYSAMGIICGAVAVAGAFIANIVLGVINFVIGIGVQLWNLISNFVNAFSIIFNNPVAAIEALFLSLFNFIVGIVEAAAGMIDTILGTNLSGAVAGFRAKVQTKIDTIVAENGGNASGAVNPNDYKLKPFSYSGAWDAGYNWGANLGSGGSGGLGSIPNSGAYTPTAAANAANNAGQTANNTGTTAGNTGQTAENTAAIANAVDISNEQLKYLRDIAERDTVNRFTTASIKVTMTNNNNVNSGMDLDGIVNDLAYGVESAMAMAAEGVHK